MSELYDHASHARRAPMRFVWRMDAEQRFTVGSAEFIALMGSATAAALGRPRAELAAALSLDPEDQVALALASHETAMAPNGSRSSCPGCQSSTASAFFAATVVSAFAATPWLRRRTLCGCARHASPSRLA